MSHKEYLIKLRSRVVDAVNTGLIPSEGKEVYEQTLIQIMNEAERNRIRCSNLAEDYKLKAEAASSQAAGFDSMIAIVYSILNGFVRKSEDDLTEIAEMQKEADEDEAADKASKKTSKKTAPKRAASKRK